MAGMEQWWDTRTHAVNVVVCHAGYPATGPAGADGCVLHVTADEVRGGDESGKVQASTVACYVANAARESPTTYRSTKGGRLLSVVATDTPAPARPSRKSLKAPSAIEGGEAADDEEGGTAVKEKKELKAPREALASEADVEKLNKLFGMSSASK